MGLVVMASDDTFGDGDWSVVVVYLDTCNLLVFKFYILDFNVFIDNVNIAIKRANPRKCLSILRTSIVAHHER